MATILNWDSDYPIVVDTVGTNFPTLADGVNYISASHLNSLASAVVELQNVVGGFRTTPVVDPLSPTDGDYLTYNSGSGEWVATTLSNLQEVITESTTGRIAADTDSGAIVLCTNAAGCTIDLDALSVGFVCSYVQMGASQVVLTGSYTYRIPSGAVTPPRTASQYSAITVTVISPTEVLVTGDYA